MSGSEAVELTSDAGLHFTVAGNGPRTVFIHGNMVNAVRAWKGQLPLAQRFTLVMPDRRGFEPNPAWGRCDFEVDALDIGPLLEDGAHLVAHSYGALAALWIANARPDSVRSLTLIEPPAHRLALDEPHVQTSVKDRMALDECTDPEEFMLAFTSYVGGDPTLVRLPLDPTTLQHVLAQMDERLPWDEPLPTTVIAERALPTLIVTGGHSEVFELVADRLALVLGPRVERQVMMGAGHSVQRLGGPFNDRLEEFWGKLGTFRG